MVPPQVQHICFQMFPGHRQQMEEMSAETGSDLLRHTEQNQEFGSGAALICRIYGPARVPASDVCLVVPPSALCPPR